MSISESEINRVIKLAHLSLSPETVAKFSEQVRGIIGHMAVLSEAPIEGLSATDPNAPSTPVQSDIVDTGFGNCASANPANMEGPFFVVPKIAGSESE